MLHLQHPPGQAVGRIPGQDRHARLAQDRAAIVLFGDQVHGRSGDGIAAREHRLVHPAPVHAGPAVQREQGGMNVDDPPAPGIHHGFGHPLQVAGQHDELHPGLLQNSQPLGGIGAILKDVGRDSLSSGQREPSGLGAITDHQDHPRGGAGPEGAEERRQVAAPSRHHDRDAQEHSPEV